MTPQQSKNRPGKPNDCVPAGIGLRSFPKRGKDCLLTILEPMFMQIGNGLLKGLGNLTNLGQGGFIMEGKHEHKHLHAHDHAHAHSHEHSS